MRCLSVLRPHVGVLATTELPEISKREEPLFFSTELPDHELRKLYLGIKRVTLDLPRPLEESGLKDYSEQASSFGNHIGECFAPHPGRD